MPRTRGSSMAPSCRPQNGVMRAVGIEQLSHLPFVRHQLDPERVRGAWCSGDAAVVVVRRGSRGGAGHRGHRLRRPRTAPAARRRRWPGRCPDRVMVPRRPTTSPTPGRWQSSGSGTGCSPPTSQSRRPPRWCRSPTTRSPGCSISSHPTHTRGRGTPGIEPWLGIRDEARLAAVGAVLRQPDGTGHVRGVAVAESQRGRGLGRELSRALTRAAMADSGVCSLGVYVDNEPALRTYRSLGYEVVHTFTSGPVSESPSTTASAPSR